jgi:hypothetical protein
MIELLSWGKQHGWDRLKNAIEEALELGCTDAAAVRHLLNVGELARPRREDCELHPGLQQYERPLPVMREYDLLLKDAEVAR